MHKNKFLLLLLYSVIFHNTAYIHTYIFIPLLRAVPYVEPAHCGTPELKKNANDSIIISYLSKWRGRISPTRSIVYFVVLLITTDMFVHVCTGQTIECCDVTQKMLIFLTSWVIYFLSCLDKRHVLYVSKRQQCFNKKSTNTKRFFFREIHQTLQGLHPDSKKCWLFWLCGYHQWFFESTTGENTYTTVNVNNFSLKNKKSTIAKLNSFQKKSSNFPRITHRFQ